jgi:Uma2 family endonuclease
MAQPALEHDLSRGNTSHDHVVVFERATWADYRRLLELRGDRSSPRIFYSEGMLEIMSPGKAHERIKSVAGRLVEAWCLFRGVEITPYGSWTIESSEAERGAEPDECYVIGDAADAERPDLAIEVVFTSGGIDKLDVYSKLAVREIWIWKSGAFSAYALRGERYEAIEHSEALPGIDLAELARFVEITPMTRAVREYRAELERRAPATGR